MENKEDKTRSETPVIQKDEMTTVQPETYPLLPLRDIVVFPHMVVPLFVGREKSVRALDSILSQNKQLFLVAQRDPTVDDPEIKDLNTVGTLGTVLQLLRLPDGTIKVLVEGTTRAQLEQVIQEDPFFSVTLKEYRDKEEQSPELEALARSVMNQFEQYVRLNKRLPPEVLVSVSQIKDPTDLADAIAAHLTLKLAEK